MELGFWRGKYECVLWKHVGVLRIGALLEWRLHRKLDLRPNQLGQVFFPPKGRLYVHPREPNKCFLPSASACQKKAALPRQVLWNARWSIDFSFCFWGLCETRALGDPGFSHQEAGDLLYNAIQTTQLAECYGFQNSNPEKDEPLKPCHSQSTHWSSIFNKIQTHLIFDHSRPMDIDMAIICARVQAPIVGLSYRIINPFCIYQQYGDFVSPLNLQVLEDCLKVTLKCGQFFWMKISKTWEVEEIPWFNQNMFWYNKILHDYKKWDGRTLQYWNLGTSISRQIHHSQHRYNGRGTH